MSLRRLSLAFALGAAAFIAAHGGSAQANEEFDSLEEKPKNPGILFEHAPKLYTFKLDDSSASLSLLRSYFDASVERPGPYNRYVGGPYGRWSKDPWMNLSWGKPAIDVARDDTAAGVPLSENEEETALRPVMLGAPAAADELPSAFGFEAPDRDLHVRLPANDWLTRLFVAGDEPPFWTTGPSLSSNGFDALWAPPQKPIVDWRCRRRPVIFVTFGGESERVSLVRCNGSIEPGAVDRLSILARPPSVPDPGVLPDEPDPAAWEASGEWLPSVKLLHPRLLWALQKVADAFPYRAIYVYSGYRPHRDKPGAQGHHSMHGEGRAMDIQIHGVRNESLFQFCRKLDDVGCGYYQNSKFVHVDVRKPGTGHAFWVDISGPGEPSHYVDSWPGVVESGALAWMRLPDKNSGFKPGRARVPDDRGSADIVRK
ncbi:MAG: DUF882 domain-containing protein [Polyangiaceae bacterium]|nr:DUF882 domain-containing protein [Polyangiaceae bacterium]